MKQEINKLAKPHKKNGNAIVMVIAPVSDSGADTGRHQLQALARTLNPARLVDVPYSAGANLNTDGTAFILNIPRATEGKSITYQAFSRLGTL
jgi:hypothetical protein